MPGYSTSTRQEIFAALRSLAGGNVEPDAKEREPLIGFYTIPFGGTATASPKRIVLIQQRGQWFACYAIHDHDYRRAEDEIMRWLEGMTKRKQGRLASATSGLRSDEVYRNERALRNTGNVEHLSREQCVSLLRRVLTDFNFPGGENAEIDFEFGRGKSQVAWYMDTIPPTPAVVLDIEMQDDLTILHEAAHILRNGPTMAGRQSGGDANEAHDDQWLAKFRGLVHSYGGEKTKRHFRIVFDWGEPDD